MRCLLGNRSRWAFTRQSNQLDSGGHLPFEEVYRNHEMSIYLENGDGRVASAYLECIY
jgi:hypothetical protein